MINGKSYGDRLELLLLFILALALITFVRPNPQDDICQGMRGKLEGREGEGPLITLLSTSE
jgi:hypothetical protein